jgi:hypothetical protein
MEGLVSIGCWALGVERWMLGVERCAFISAFQFSAFSFSLVLHHD